MLAEFENMMVAEVDKKYCRRQLVDRDGTITKNLFRILVWNWRDDIDIADDDEQMRRDLVRLVKRQYRATFGFDPLTLIIIQALIRIAIELFLYWWKNRGDSKILEALQMECQQFNIRE